MPSDTDVDNPVMKAAWEAFLDDLEEEAVAYTSDLVQTFSQINDPEEETVQESVIRLLEAAKKGGHAKKAKGHWVTIHGHPVLLTGTKSATTGAVKGILAGHFPGAVVKSLPHGGVEVSHSVTSPFSAPTNMDQFSTLHGEIKAHLEQSGAVAKTHPSGNIHVTHIGQLPGSTPGPVTSAVTTAVGQTGKMSATVGAVSKLLHGDVLAKVSSLPHGGVKVQPHQSTDSASIKAHLEKHGAVVKVHPAGHLVVSHFSSPSAEAQSHYVAKTKATPTTPKAKPQPKMQPTAANRDNATTVLESAGILVHKDYSGFTAHGAAPGVYVKPHSSGTGVFIKHNQGETHLGPVKAALEKAGATIGSGAPGVSGYPSGLHVTHVMTAPPAPPPKPKPAGPHNPKDINPPTEANHSKVHGALNDLPPGSGAQDYKVKIQTDLAGKLKDNKEFTEMSKRKLGYPSDETNRQNMVSSLVSNWAGSSGDSNSEAVKMQHAVQQEFGLKDVAMGHLTVASHQGDPAKHEDLTGMRAFARQMYDHTQEHLKAQGLDHVTVYRGVRSGEGVTFSGKLETTTVKTQPASSWSYDFDTAKNFAGGGFNAGAVMSARIPRERILGTFRTGFGCRNEQEVVVLGGVDKVGIWGWKQGPYPLPQSGKDMLLPK